MEKAIVLGLFIVAMTTAVLMFNDGFLFVG